MRVATATFVTPTDERLRFIRQMGVTDIILWGTTFRSPRNPGGGAVSFKELVALRNQAEAHGLRVDRKSTRLNSSHSSVSRMPSSA